MAAPELSFQIVYEFFVENGGKVKNKDAVRHFKRYLTDPARKNENRLRFKEYVNALAHTKQEGDEKVLILKTKYLNRQEPPSSPLSTSSSSLSLTQNDPRNNVGLPNVPVGSGFQSYGSTTSLNTPTRQPPPYRNPPPVVSPSASLDSISLSSASTQEERPSAPPRRRSNATESDGAQTSKENNLASPEDNKENMEKSGLSVKERTQQFNRLASVEDELSPRVPKSAEKDRNKSWMADDTDISPLTPLEPKKCQEWYVTASRGDCQELLKLARDEPRLVNKKDPFTTVLHWGAKYGNAEIIKIFAGKYKVNVNGKTNGGYTPLHISAQFDHRNIFKLLIEVYKADTKIRDYSGRTAEYYLLSKEQKENSQVTLRKTKGRKKQSDKDLGFLRIGSLNVRVKKTTEAFSNFLGVGNSGSVNPINSTSEEVQKGWGSADNISKDCTMQPPKGVFRKKSKRAADSGLSSTPSTPRAPVKNYSTSSLPLTHHINDSDSDNAAGFDSNWQN
ncbi:ankyrin repeat domain-containing protein SOWAHB isoform X3 [Dendroctonus ponderosae]|uniref:ankyrin repeat domain-containing protein SOWAHB isoform X3 n=1 Tax=Dendroctonus ponderosae TaxID=77166 RepID=UPI0020354443|nr:ankyrin repeat domain-containing protein SOWAHB isoform X3 [Dendroctonus ponderosae]